MNKLLCILLLLVVTSLNKVYATVDFTEGILGMNFTVQIASGTSGGEATFIKSRCICFLLKKYLAENYHDTEYVSINFGVYNSYRSDRFFFHQQPYCLGYYSSRSFITDTSKGFYSHDAVVLYVLTDSINLNDCFKLIDYAIHHKKQIVDNQHSVLAAKFHNTFGQMLSANPFTKDALQDGICLIKTISGKQIDRILADSHTSSYISKLLKYRFYRQWAGSAPSIGKVDYYCQNDSFFLYETNKVNANIYKNLPYGNVEKYLCDTTRSTLPRFSNIDNFVSDRNDNYFVFTSEGVYYFQLDKFKLFGPIDMPTIGGKIGRYSIILDSVKVKDGVATLAISTWYGDYYVDYNIIKASFKIDSNSINPQLKRFIASDTADKPFYKPVIGDLFN